MNRRAAKSLLDALLGCAEIEELVGDISLENFLLDRTRQLVAKRLLAVVGESLHQVEIEDPSLVENIPDLRKIVGIRNVIVHGYRDIRLEVTWEAAVLRIPTLKSALQELLDEYDSMRQPAHDPNRKERNDPA